MKKFLITAAAAMFAVGSQAHGDDDADDIGAPGHAAKVTRTVAVDMADTMRFNPSSITARQGETIRFSIRNSGQVKHEFVLGTEKELKEHYELMKKFPEMEHSDANMVTVAPGQAGEVIWQFTKAGRIDFACLQPGHYDAGMKGVVDVAASRVALVGMTMVFHVKDPALLDMVKQGDKAQFKADKANGALVVTEMQLAK